METAAAAALQVTRTGRSRRWRRCHKGHGHQGAAQSTGNTVITRRCGRGRGGICKASVNHLPTNARAQIEEGIREPNVILF